jgi:beta-glucanase (GH16 family)
VAIFVAPAGISYQVGMEIENYSGSRSYVVAGFSRYLGGQLTDVHGDAVGKVPANAADGDLIVFCRPPAPWSRQTSNLIKKLFSAMSALMLLAGCGGNAGTGAPVPATQSQSQQETLPAQPTPTGSAQFSMFGFTWQKHASNAPGGGTFSKDNVDVQSKQVVLTLDEDGFGNSTGAEIATVTPLTYGTYTFIYKQDVVQSGSIASGFSYITGSVTEIDVEQQGQYPDRWYFTNYQSVPNKDSSFVDGYDATNYHTLSYRWTPTEITWFLDGVQVGQHQEFIPLQAAPFLFNFWGTNSSKWGGVATPGTRHMAIVSFSFQPES